MLNTIDSDFPYLGFGLEIIILAVVLAIVALLMIRAIVNLKNADPPIMVTAVLGLLTLVAIAAAVATGHEALTTLAATGLGALAGAVTNLFTPHERALLRHLGEVQEAKEKAESEATEEKKDEGPVG